MQKVLMISLDKKILDPKSATARRMVEYGKKERLFILLPAHEARQFELSPTVRVQATGGNRLVQYQRLKTVGYNIIIHEKATLVTTQDPFFTGRIGVWLKRKTGVKFEVQIHGDFYDANYYRKGGWKNWLRYHLGKRVIRQADRLRVVGERIKQSLLSLGVEAKRIETRPIRVDANWIKAYESKIDRHERYPDYRRIFLVLGRAESVKNVSWLIKLWGKTPVDCLLLIVGEGSERHALEQQARQLGLTNVRFEDWTDDPISYLKIADALLFPSLSEGYGLVVMEAVAAGTPVIMNDVGVANYELKPSEKVQIIPVTDKQAWLKAIKYL